MFGKQSSVPIVPSFAEAIGLVLAFFLGFLSVGFWTGLFAALFTYADQNFKAELVGAELADKSGWGFKIALIVVVSLRFLFPSVAMFDELTRIGFANLLASLVVWLIEPRSDKQ